MSKFWSNLVVNLKDFEQKRVYQRNATAKRIGFLDYNSRPRPQIVVDHNNATKNAFH